MGAMVIRDPMPVTTARTPKITRIARHEAEGDERALSVAIRQERARVGDVPEALACRDHQLTPTTFPSRTRSEKPASPSVPSDI